MKEILLFELRENIRSKWIFLFSGILALGVGIVNYFGDENSTRTIASLTNVILLVVPLFSITFSGLVFLESLPFAELLLSKSVSRTSYFLGKYLGISLSLLIGLVVGIGIPGILSFYSDLRFLLLFCELIGFGGVLIFIFVSLAFLLATFLKRGEWIVSGALFVWLYFFIFFDSIVFVLSLYLGEYPIEVPSIIIILLNPIDLIRILMILQTKTSVLLGFSGAFLLNSLGPYLLVCLCLLFLSGWIALPLWIAHRRFLKRNF